MNSGRESNDVSPEPRISAQYNDLDAEFTLAAICVDDPAALESVADMIDPDEFFDPTARLIWSGYQTARARGETYTIESLTADTSPPPSVNVSSSIQDVLELAAGTPREAEWCAWRVRSAALTRQILMDLEMVTSDLVAGHGEEAASRLRTAVDQANLLVVARRSSAEALVRLNRTG
jgi:replicative DNA helicase